MICEEEKIYKKGIVHLSKNIDFRLKYLKILKVYVN